MNIDAVNIAVHVSFCPASYDSCHPRGMPPSEAYSLCGWPNLGLRDPSRSDTMGVGATESPGEGEPLGDSSATGSQAFAVRSAESTEHMSRLRSLGA